MCACQHPHSTRRRPHRPSTQHPHNSPTHLEQVNVGAPDVQLQQSRCTHAPWQTVATEQHRRHIKLHTYASTDPPPRQLHGKPSVQQKQRDQPSQQHMAAVLYWAGPNSGTHSGGHRRKYTATKQAGPQQAGPQQANPLHRCAATQWNAHLRRHNHKVNAPLTPRPSYTQLQRMMCSGSFGEPTALHN